MKFWGLELTARPPFVAKAAGVTADPNGALGAGWTRWAGFNRIHEPFPGAWQKGVEVDSPKSLMAFSAVYACLSLISSDIAKLRIKLVEQDPKTRIWTEIDSSAFSPVLRKPNDYQTRIQFLQAWVLSKLIYGNTYVLKQRDARGVVKALYVLDPTRVTARVTVSGDVYYQLNRDDLHEVRDNVLVSSTEIIHDRGPCLFHPLVGIPPIYACAISATKGNRIQSNSQQFFANLSRPGGVLSAPEVIQEETIQQLKAQFEANFSGSNLGRLLVVGDGMTYTSMSIPAQQAQLIEQLQWTAVDVARAFGVPPHKLATGANPTYNNIGALNQDYYSQSLQTHIEAIEILLDEGLGLTAVPGRTLGTELDLDGLLRMDEATLIAGLKEGVKGSFVAPNEARARIGLPPVPHGDLPLVQQQDLALDQIGRDQTPVAAPTPTYPPPAPTPPEPAPPAPPTPESLALAAAIERRLRDLEFFAKQSAKAFSALAVSEDDA